MLWGKIHVYRYIYEERVPWKRKNKTFTSSCVTGKRIELLSSFYLLLWLFGTDVDVSVGLAVDVCRNETGCFLLFRHLMEESQKVLDGLGRGLNVKNQS